MRSVEWLHSRRQLLLPVAILPPLTASNPTQMVRTVGLLDTGATGSALHPRLVDELALVRRGQRRVETANGTFIAAEMTARIGFFPDTSDNGDGHSFPYVLDAGLLAFELLAGFNHDVLIGMDVIGQCDLHLLRDGSARMVLP